MMKPDILEEWRPVPGWEGIYAVSSIGRVRRLIGNRPNGVYSGRCKRGKCLKPLSNNKGYCRVELRHLKRPKRSAFIHPLFAEAFIGPRPEGKVVAHCDGDRLNNAASNLRYCSPAENEQDKYRHGTRAIDAHPNAKLTKEAAQAIRRRYKPYCSLNGSRALGREFGVDSTTVRRVICGETWQGV